jgi:hypothetical protein
MTDPTEGTRTPEAALAEAINRALSWTGEGIAMNVVDDILANLHPDVRLINVTELVETVARRMYESTFLNGESAYVWDAATDAQRVAWLETARRLLGWEAG